MTLILTEIKGIKDNYVIGGGGDIDLFTTPLLSLIVGAHGSLINTIK